ncbi:MAG: Gfo/Idh/MocA family oxidoreductase [Chloroflexi bacterium]|nr:Gfo/Idh/MocA family oxidoreductase [Chloroflexota bacterium]
MTDPRPLGVALVGCGAVSKLYYVPALKQLESLRQVQVAALFDPDPANLAQIHQEFPGAAQVRDFDELTGLGLDLAIVASPPQYHAGQTIHLLQAGWPVLCEKPMALSVAEGGGDDRRRFDLQPRPVHRSCPPFLPRRADDSRHCVPECFGRCPVVLLLRRQGLSLARSIRLLFSG